jgi:hypothetical protein
MSNPKEKVIIDPVEVPPILLPEPPGIQAIVVSTDNEGNATANIEIPAAAMPDQPTARSIFESLDEEEQERVIFPPGLNDITLYHFTSIDHLAGIVQDGIYKGEVPISVDGGFQAPWFTEDRDAHLQEWTRSYVYTKKNYAHGREPKRRVRLTVNVPDKKELWRWSDLAMSLRINTHWYQILHRTGGKRSDAWWVYLGNVHPSCIVLAEYLDDDGQWKEITGLKEEKLKDLPITHIILTLGDGTVRHFDAVGGNRYAQGELLRERKPGENDDDIEELQKQLEHFLSSKNLTLPELSQSPNPTS